MAVFDGVTPAIVGAAGAGADAGYEIERSLRFNSADGAYLDRTPSSAGNRKTWTWSGWVKRSGADVTRILSTFTIPWTDVAINSSSQVQIVSNSGSGGAGFRTAAVLRDFSAWYHIVIAVDTTQATATDRVKFYINGSQSQTVTLAGGATPQNYDTSINATNLHHIGRSERIGYGSIQYTNNYLTEIHFIDGQALDPSNFGEQDDNGVWQPKDCKDDLTYGTNGFYLNFADNTSTATLGTDSSGNNHTWGVNNFSVAPGAGNDSLVDSPTNGTQTDTGAGGEVVGNYATLNPLDEVGVTLANGNLDATIGAGGDKRVIATIGVGSGKYYFEFTKTANSGGNGLIQIGVSAVDQNDNVPGFGAYGWSYCGNGLKYNDGISVSYGSTYAAGDTIGCALDMDSGKVWWSKNGVFQNSGDPAAGTNAAFTNLSGYVIAPSTADASGNSGNAVSFNAGQRPFAYTAPSGYKALCTKNLPNPTIADGSTVMDVVIYTGDGSTSRSITGLGFSPDLVWVKCRSNAENHVLSDIVRGANKQLFSSSTSAETSNTNEIQAFNSDGFDVGNNGRTNFNSFTYVGWAWDGGTSTVSNTDGSITSSVRANASAGFSIVGFTDTGSACTVGHGLGAAPELIIVKFRGATGNWSIYHKDLGNTKRLRFTTEAALGPDSGFWNNTSPTSTVFSLGSSLVASTTQIAYCFAPVDGYSSFGSYTGNGSTDGPFVFTGFRPRFILLKTTTRSGDQWIIQDTSRDRSNISDTYLFPNSSNAEGTASGGIDILSNGFKLRDTSGSYNASGDTYIYAAFAEYPFKTARAR